MEAEEIVKALDMEQGEETPTSTATSAEVVRAPLYPPAALPPPPLHPPPADEPPEEAENTIETDLPPLTGEDL